MWCGVWEDGELYVGDEVVVVWGVFGCIFCVMKAESRRLRRAWRDGRVANQGLELRCGFRTRRTVTV